VTTVGAGRVVPRALPTVDAEGHGSVMMAALAVGVAVGAGVDVEPLDVDGPPDDAVEEAPQAASAAAESIPTRILTRVVRRDDMGCAPPGAGLFPGS
jgi:hypothetical protein